MAISHDTYVARPAIAHAVQAAHLPSRLVQRIRAEYLEMPGLALTPVQAARLWGEDVRQVTRLLGQLVSTGFLMRNARGAYRRCDCPRCS